VQRSDEPSGFSHQQDATSGLEQLMRLERYERRVLSRRKCAIRAFSVLSREI
jgi:hypothetical protein